MEAVLKKMKALRVEKENVFSQVDPRFVQNFTYSSSILDMMRILDIPDRTLDIHCLIQILINAAVL